MSSLRTGDAAPIKVKKYANRRLYNTATSSYVTLDHLSQMVKNGQQFVVEDAKTHEDITRSVLTQIIVEEESKGHHLLPISFLRQLISLYGDNLQWMVPNYLEYSMQVFSRNQEQIRQYFQEAMTGLFPFGTIEEVGKQQMAMFERALKIFSPFPEDLPPGGDSGIEVNRIETADVTRKPASFTASPAPSSEQSIEDLQRRLAELESHLEDLGKTALNLGDRAQEGGPVGKADGTAE